MKIAFPVEGEMISPHFGHCSNFEIFEIEENNPSFKKSVINTPEHHSPGELPRILHEQGVDLIIADGIGQKAIEFFTALNIKVLIGVKGIIKEVLTSYLNGTLKGGENHCSH